MALLEQQWRCVESIVYCSKKPNFKTLLEKTKDGSVFIDIIKLEDAPIDDIWKARFNPFAMEVIKNKLKSDDFKNENLLMTFFDDVDIYCEKEEKLLDYIIYVCKLLDSGLDINIWIDNTVMVYDVVVEIEKIISQFNQNKSDYKNINEYLLKEFDVEKYYANKFEENVIRSLKRISQGMSFEEWLDETTMSPEVKKK